MQKQTWTGRSSMLDFFIISHLKFMKMYLQRILKLFLNLTHDVWKVLGPVALIWDSVHMFRPFLDETCVKKLISLFQTNSLCSQDCSAGWSVRVQQRHPSDENALPQGPARPAVTGAPSPGQFISTCVLEDFTWCPWQEKGHRLRQLWTEQLISIFFSKWYLSS